MLACIPKAQVAQIAASIAEYDFNNPVLIGPEGVIIAGHARVLAAQKLGRAGARPSCSGVSPKIRSEPSYWRTINWLNAGWHLDMLRLELKALAAYRAALEAGDAGVVPVNRIRPRR